MLIIAGTLQPKPIIIGIKALPDNPNLRKIRSRIKATRAIYPVSSKIEKNKNNNKICGTKDKTAKTPPRIPSQINPPTQEGEASSNEATQDVILSVRIPTRFCKITPMEFIPPSVHNNPSKAVPSKLELFNNPPK